jgi:hypothetical protein
VEAPAGDDASAVVHLRLRTDTRPHLRAAPEDDQAASGARFRDIAFEMSPEKLDVLVHDLSQVQALLGGLKN